MLVTETTVHVCDRRLVVGHQGDENRSSGCVIGTLSSLLVSGF